MQWELPQGGRLDDQVLAERAVQEQLDDVDGVVAAFGALEQGENQGVVPFSILVEKAVFGGLSNQGLLDLGELQLVRPSDRDRQVQRGVPLGVLHDQVGLGELGEQLLH